MSNTSRIHKIYIFKIKENSPSFDKLYFRLQREQDSGSIYESQTSGPLHQIVRILELVSASRRLQFYVIKSCVTLICAICCPSANKDYPTLLTGWLCPGSKAN